MTKGPSFTPIGTVCPPSETGRNHALILPPWHGHAEGGDLVSIVAHQEIAVVIEYLSRPCRKKKKSKNINFCVVSRRASDIFIETIYPNERERPKWTGSATVLADIRRFRNFDERTCLSVCPSTSQSAHFLLIKSFPNRSTIFEVCGFGGQVGQNGRVSLICIRRAPFFHLPA